MRLYDSKKICLLMVAILVGSILGGYKAYNAFEGSVKAGLSIGGTVCITGLLIALWVIYRGNKKGEV